MVSVSTLVNASITPRFEGVTMSDYSNIVITISIHCWKVTLQSTLREESQCSHYPWATITPHFEGVAMSDYPNIIITISSHYWEVTLQSTSREESQCSHYPWASITPHFEGVLC
jgi:hypothetical protein